MKRQANLFINVLLAACRLVAAGCSNQPETLEALKEKAKTAINEIKAEDIDEATKAKIGDDLSSAQKSLNDMLTLDKSGVEAPIKDLNELIKNATGSV